MQGYAQVALAGNLTRDPETKTFDSGSSITEFGVAVNTQRKSGEEWVDEVSFFDVAVWGGFGELIARKLVKGDLVSVAGTLEQQSWEDAEGNKRSKVRVIGRSVTGEGFFRPADGSSGSATAAQPAPAAEAAPAATSAQGAATASGDDIPF